MLLDSPLIVVIQQLAFWFDGMTIKVACVARHRSSTKVVSVKATGIHVSVVRGESLFLKCLRCEESEWITICLGHNLDARIEGFKERHVHV